MKKFLTKQKILLISVFKITIFKYSKNVKESKILKIL